MAATQEDVTRVGLEHGPVVVGVDGSPESYRALDWAAAYARDTDRDLRLVHAYGGGAAALRLELAAQGAEVGHTREAQQVLETATGYARSLVGDRVDGALHLGGAAGALREESRSAAVVVVGSRDHGGLTGLLLGAVGVPLSAHAACPVVVVRGRERQEPKPDAPVVVGLDGSGESGAAVGFAMAEAQRLGSPLTAVLAWDELWIGAPELADPVPDKPSLQEAAVRMVSETIAGWTERYPDVRVTRVVERGHPAPVLLREAQGARLVVVGSRGRGGFGGLLLGSTSQTLLHRSPTTVAVVRRA
ncbi:universal stress protein [Aquipuribacter nitratireducens]|uniref:Universal stress protein n=1 Tax=Aquipuribacter nitratireducens TaxID=650104 RepID=A0ABW0GQ05_9MICO